MIVDQPGQLPRVKADALTKFAALIFERAGMSPDDAYLTADTLVKADLWGHQTHGVMRLPWYVGRLKSGAVKADAAPELVMDSGAVMILDGHDAMGQVSATRATDLAIERAKAHGIAAVAVRNSNHFGTAMYFTRKVARAGCVGFLSTNASPAMPPWGGRSKAVGTNPWSWAAPAGLFPPMVLDVANTSVARGKIYLARQNGVQIPLGWALDAEGHPTTDPVDALGGVTLPMAGHKGYGIAVMMDMLSGVLSGSQFGRRVNGPYQTEMPGGTGHMTIALNIDAFQPQAEFAEHMEQMIAELKATPLAAGHEEIFYPGELEARSEASLLDVGIALPYVTVTDLEQLAQEWDCPEALPLAS